jgi:hypothetical protein
LKKIILIVLLLISIFGACKRTEKFFKTSFKEFPFLPDNEVIGGGQLKDIKSFTLREIEYDTYGESKYYEGTVLISLDGKNYKAGVEFDVIDGQIFRTSIKIPSDEKLLVLLLEKLSTKYKFTEVTKGKFKAANQVGILEEHYFENSELRLFIWRRIGLFSYSTLDGMEERQFTELEINTKRKNIESLSN